MQVECKVKMVSLRMIFFRLLGPMRPLVVLDYAALTPALNPIRYILYCSSYNYHGASWGASHLAERSSASVNI